MVHDMHAPRAAPASRTPGGQRVKLELTTFSSSLEVATQQPWFTTFMLFGPHRRRVQRAVRGSSWSRYSTCLRNTFGAENVVKQCRDFGCSGSFGHSAVPSLGLGGSAPRATHYESKVGLSPLWKSDVLEKTGGGLKMIADPSLRDVDLVRYVD